MTTSKSTTTAPIENPELRPGLHVTGMYGDNGRNGTIRYVAPNGVLIEPDPDNPTDRGEWFFCVSEDVQIDAVQPDEVERVEAEAEPSVQEHQPVEVINYETIGAGGGVGIIKGSRRVPVVVGDSICDDGTIGLVEQVLEHGAIYRTAKGEQHFVHWSDAVLTHLGPDEQEAETPTATTGGVGYLRLRPGLVMDVYDDGDGSIRGKLIEATGHGVVIEVTDKTSKRHGQKYAGTWDDGIQVYPDPDDFASPQRGFTPRRGMTVRYRDDGGTTASVTLLDFTAATATVEDFNNGDKPIVVSWRAIEFSAEDVLAWQHGEAADAPEQQPMAGWGTPTPVNPFSRVRRQVLDLIDALRRLRVEEQVSHPQPISEDAALWELRDSLVGFGDEWDRDPDAFHEPEERAVTK